MTAFEAAEACGSDELTDYNADTGIIKTRNFALAVSGAYWECLTDVSGQTNEACSVAYAMAFYETQV
jgi:hypothetical protein